MKIFLIICLASGLASSEKLDRTYLPPPGSKFSGGSPGDIETPLEFPKHIAPQQGNGMPEKDLINRPALTSDQKHGVNVFQKSYVPKITTSYAITQTTTFAPDNEYTGIDQPGGVLNGSTVQSGYPGQHQGPYKYRPGQSQSTVAPYGTTVRPQFPGVFHGPEYLPPVSNNQSPAQVINQGGSKYPSGLPEAPKYQDGQAVSVNKPGSVSQQNEYTGNTNIPSTSSRVPTGPDSQQSQNQFSGSQFPSTATQYQDGQRFITPGSNQKNQFTGSLFPSSTVATQYQGGQRLTTPGLSQQSQFTGSQFPSSTVATQHQGGPRLKTPGSNQQSQFIGNQFSSSTAAPQLITPESNQQNQFSGNQEFLSSTATPQLQFGQRFTTPGLNQQAFGARAPNQQNQVTGNQYQGNRNFQSSTTAPTPGSIEQSQFLGNQNFPSTTALPTNQDELRFTTPGQIQGALIPGQPGSGSRVPIQSQNQFTGQTFPTSTSSSQFQEGAHLTTPGYVEERYASPAAIQKNQNQYPGNLNYPSSPASRYQNGQQFTTPGTIGNQNFPSTAAANYQGGPRFTTPGQYNGQYVPEQQTFGSYIPGQINQSQSSVASQYQDSQRFSTPGTQGRFDSLQPNQQNQYPGQNYPTSTTAPQYQDGQRISTPGSGQTFGSPQLNQYSTAALQYQGQRITTPGQLFNQTTYPGSTAAPQYQQTLVPIPGINQEGVLSRQDQLQPPVFNQQFPLSTASPQGFFPGSQSQYGDTNILTPGGQVYENNKQPTSQTGASFASTTVGSLPARDFASTPGFGNIGGRPERPQAEGERNAEILSYETVLTPEGYFYSYDTSNGIHADETGTVGNGSRAQGGFSYTGDDGKVYSVVYSADENGFQSRGDHLPTPPPIPEAIQRVIDQANKDKESESDDDGSYNEEKYGYMKYEGILNRLRPRNRTISAVNGADIPDKANIRISENTKKTSKTKGRKPVSTGDNEEFESDYESEIDETDINGDNLIVNSNLDNNMDKNRRITSKRPKPIKNLNVVENRSDKLNLTKMPLKPTNPKTGSLQKITSEEDEENTSDDLTEESEVNGDLQESQGLDYDSDLVNYKDDPNNRTDFHGLNKYLPESKKTNRKNLTSKKRPAVRVKGMKQSIGVKAAEIPEDGGLDFIEESRTRIPSRNNKIGKKVKGLANITGQTISDGDDETDSYVDDITDTDEEFRSDYEIKPVTNDRVRKPGTSRLNKKISGKPKRPNVNERTDMSDDKETEPSSYEDKGYEYTPPQRKFGSEETLKFPSKINQKGAQTTLRPLMTKNVYGDDTESADDYNNEYGAQNPGRGRPMTGTNQYPGRYQESDSYNRNNPEVNEEDGFFTTRRPVSYGTSRPLGRPQTTSESYNQNNPEVNENNGLSTTKMPASYGTSRPFGRTQAISESYNQNNPEVNEDNGFSTTRRPVSYGTSRPFGRPQATSESYNQNNPEVNENNGFSTTKRPVSYGTSRPFGRTQATSESYNQNHPEVNEDNGFSTTMRPVSYGTSRPFGRPQATSESYNQNNPEVNEDNGFSTTKKPVSYGTSRPFGRPQAISESYNQKNTEVNEDNGFSTTKRPVSYGTSRPFGRPQATSESFNQNHPEVNEDNGFSTTRRPVSYGTTRPFGRPQATSESYNQNNPEVNEDNGFSTTKKPVSYGTSRPFGRPQAISEGYNQKNPEVNEDNGFSTTKRPVSYGTSRPFGRPQTTGETYIQNNPQVNEDEQFSTTKGPITYGTSRPFGRPQNTGTPRPHLGLNGQVYNPTIQQRPGDKSFYNPNAPTQGTVRNIFSSTTPLPPSGLGYNYPHPSSQNRPTDGSYTPDGATYNAATSGQLPSTTYRPNYSFGDKILSPVTVDGFGRPIQNTNAPVFDRTLKPTGGRFGVTSTLGPAEYQSSVPIGEDFSGPKQPQRFDPLTGYHYK